jgi:hypothetical protein
MTFGKSLSSPGIPIAFTNKNDTPAAPGNPMA